MDVEEANFEEQFSHTGDIDYAEEITISHEGEPLKVDIGSDAHLGLQEDELKCLQKSRKSGRIQTKGIFCQKKHESVIIKSLVTLLKKPFNTLSKEEKAKLLQYPKLAKEAKKRLERRLTAIDRLREFQDPDDQLDKKCALLARIIQNANHLVIYTGAGISTSACIPDYRGPNGIWTLLQKGQSLDSQNQVVLATADPTPTHMVICELFKMGVVKHVVSQNCDGLHLRSGIPRNALSEVHGNMYVEVCSKCNREYVRLFDVTENTRRHAHRTGRNCYRCGSLLIDSIVHFGERGTLRWPLNWAGAEYNANQADAILCLGSSLKVLRRYPWLWGMDQPANKRPALCIVNLQWTPKDQFAQLKIHGKCDEVMAKVMDKLQLSYPHYERHEDPIFRIATPLHSSESDSKSSVDLAFPTDRCITRSKVGSDNYVSFEPVVVGEVMTSKSSLKKSRGTGWLGNAWGVKPKSKKKSKEKIISQK